ncbi:IS3 family transposase [Vibrio cholerae]|nr:IS3 family transposase [Vibrio cholerae]
MTKRTRRLFSAEFKLEAAQLVLDQNYSVTEAAQTKKSHGSLDVGLTEQFLIIKKLKQSHSVKILCEVFNVHRSSYHY